MNAYSDILILVVFLWVYFEVLLELKVDLKVYSQDPVEYSSIE